MFCYKMSRFYFKHNLPDRFVISPNLETWMKPYWDGYTQSLNSADNNDQQAKSGRWLPCIVLYIKKTPQPQCSMQNLADSSEQLEAKRSAKATEDARINCSSSGLASMVCSCLSACFSHLHMQQVRHKQLIQMITQITRDKIPHCLHCSVTWT